MRKLITLISLAAILSSCGGPHMPILRVNNVPKTTSETRPNYTQDILPLFKSKCSQCHGPGSTNGNWENYDVVKTKTAIIRLRIVEKQDMPMDGKMTGEERNMISHWIDLGAPHGPGDSASKPVPEVDSESKHKEPSLYGYEEDVFPIIKSKCVMCHAPNSGLPDWSNYEIVLKSRDKILDRTITQQNMPPQGLPALTSDEKLTIEKWIQAGAPQKRTAR